MTDKQEAFVREYLVDLNASAAARRAGYSVKTAGAMSVKLMAMPIIQEAIAKAKAERSERTEITADYVLTNLKTIAERCMIEEDFNAAGANKALELLGKHLGLWTEKQETVLTGPGGGPVETRHEVKVTFVRPQHD